MTQFLPKTLQAAAHLDVQHRGAGARVPNREVDGRLTQGEAGGLHEDLALVPVGGQRVDQAPVRGVVPVLGRQQGGVADGVRVQSKRLLAHRLGGLREHVVALAHRELDLEEEARGLAPLQPRQQKPVLQVRVLHHAGGEGLVVEVARLGPVRLLQPLKM